MHSKTALGAALVGFLALLMTGLPAPAAHAAAGDLEWAAALGSRSVGNGTAVDAAGNALTTGHFQGSATFGAGEPNEITLNSAGGAIDLEIFIAKYAPDGALVWASSAGGGSDQMGNDIALDADGNALVTGYFQGSATFGAGEGNETTLTASTPAGDIYIAKYAPDGTLVWVTQASRNTSGGQGSGIAVDSAGKALVTGDFAGTATFGAGEPNETTISALGRYDVFFAKYAPDGSLLWVRSAGGWLEDFSFQISMDPDGNALLTGEFTGRAIFGAGEPNETTLTAAGGRDIFIAKYTPDGILEWVKQAGGSLSDGGKGVAVDAIGNALVTGFFVGSATFGAGESNETILTAEQGPTLNTTDIFVAHYDVDGTLLWARSAGGDDSDMGNSIAVNAAGDALLTGYFFGATATFGAGESNETTIISGFGQNGFIAKYAGGASGEQPDLLIAQQAWPKPARVYEDLVYTLTVTNQGTGEATKVLVSDWLPATVRAIWMPKSCGLVERGKVRCWLGNLAAGGELRLKIVVRPKQPGLLINRADVTAAEADLNPADNRAMLKTHVLGY